MQDLRGAALGRGARLRRIQGRGGQGEAQGPAAQEAAPAEGNEMTTDRHAHVYDCGDRSNPIPPERRVCLICREPQERTMVDNQHKKISGYRDLTEAEIALMNEVKATGATMAALVDKIQKTPDIDPRCAAIAKTELQTGLMWLVRAIARPEGF
jgi:hypothetical protein